MPHRLLLRAALFVLALSMGAYLIYFADHARQLLGFAYPIDYGEGPLLAQVEALVAGTPIWQLYADPGTPPYMVVNYPPLYLLVTAGLTAITGNALLAGRLVSLIATLGSVIAVGLLARSPRPPGQKSVFQAITPGLLAFLLLTVPIVREWSVLMRVDMLGICIGLWGLVALSRGTVLTARRAAIAGVLLTACLFTKPSLIAAPGAAVAWLVLRALTGPTATRRPARVATLSLVATMGLVGGVSFAALQWASDGWFALHVVTANANTWELKLAEGFWRQQIALRWPLAMAAALVVAVAFWRRQASFVMLPVFYTLGGVVTATGVGKVGAYNNYFLELYVGLVWLVAVGAAHWGAVGVATIKREVKITHESPSNSLPPAGPGKRGELSAYGTAITGVAFLLGALLYYPPLWDTTWLRPAGLLSPSPPRQAFGGYGLWADAARETAVLAAQTRVGAALRDEISAAGQLIFTDAPGVAAAADVASRLQAFEARQLLDQGRMGETELLAELANGAISLTVIDYLGNWLTPGVIEIVQRRYAHAGSIGTFDLYRPVETGAFRPRERAFGKGSARLNLLGFGLATPAGATFEPGELIALTLHWQRDERQPPPEAPTIIIRLATPDGYALLEDERPLLYGVYPAQQWPAGTSIQHMQPIALPAELPEGRYELSVGMRADGRDLGVHEALATLDVAAQGGFWFEETGHFVPARIMQTWAELGAVERVGLPLTPAVPFSWGRLQCFERACLEQRDTDVRQRPLGALLYLAETNRGEGCLEGLTGVNGLCPGFMSAPEQFQQPGQAVSGELLRNGWIVQWTEYTRLERAPGASTIGLGRLGEESLRLPPGGRYRWP